MRKAISLFANKRSCADDQVVSEMLNVLDEDVLDSLAEAVIKRILINQGGSGGLSWEMLLSSPLLAHPYDHDADKLDDFKFHTANAGIAITAPSVRVRRSGRGGELIPARFEGGHKSRWKS